MRYFRFLTFLGCLLFFSSPDKLFAQELGLGFLSQEDIAKLTRDANIRIRDTEYLLPTAEIKDWLIEKSSLAYNRNYLSEIENIDFCQYEKSISCALSYGSKDKNHIQKKTEIALKTDTVADYVSSLASRVDAVPDDARFKIEDGKVALFSLSKKGMKLKEKESLATIIDYLKNNASADPIILPYEEVEPENSKLDSIENLGINTLIGEGHSNFKGSPKNRIFNIKVATERFNGVLIKPGEEFSFVKTLGEVDGEHGYKPELVIKHDKTEPEFGGGICQVSTTAFRAAIYSGLEITARRNHAYPVSYYNPQGMDSTVYIPRPDLRFINNTPANILIQTKIEGTILTFSFYGTSDGRKTEVIGPKILERKPDGSMKTTFTQQVMDQSGNTIREDVFNSSYDSPSKYPHPGDTNLLSKKPKEWSEREWKKYKKDNNIR